jgi:hypothetical protein
MSSADITRRLAPECAADTWIGLCVRVIRAATRDIDGAKVATPDHYLAAIWAPSPGLPHRWPEAVVIGAPTSERTLGSLFAHLPDDARLYLTTPDDVDAVLAAEILLAGDRNLEPYQREGIAEFITAERERTRVATIERYTDRDAGFERFRARALTAPHRPPR